MQQSDDGGLVEGGESEFTIHQFHYQLEVRRKVAVGFLAKAREAGSEAGSGRNTRKGKPKETGKLRYGFVPIK